jgi:hypothetical protein
VKMIGQHPRMRLVTVLALLVAFLAAAVPIKPASAAASISLSRTTAARGDRIVVNGFGFAASDAVIVSANVTINGHPSQIQSATSTNASGAFSAALDLPSNTQSGTATVTARDFHGDTASRDVTILPLAYVKVGSPAPAIEVEANHSFYVSGEGFQAFETIEINATFSLYDGNSGLISRTLKASSIGHFYELHLTAPENARIGFYKLTARGQKSNHSATANIGIVYRPTLSVAPTVLRPGGTAIASGRGWVPGTQVGVSAAIGRVGLSDITLTETATTAANGAFDIPIPLPGSIRVGTYTVVAVDPSRNLRASDKLTVTVHPLLSVTPASAFPGATLTVEGGGYGLRVRVNVHATFGLRTGGSTTVSHAVDTDSRGSFTADLRIPAGSGPGRVTIIASSSNARATAQIVVKAFPPTPTPAPPTATPTATTPATATPTATTIPKHHKPFRFDWISVWYHTVRVGTLNVIQAQGSPHTQLGIWVHVWFPNGSHDDYYENTDRHGFWQRQFPVGNVISPNSNIVLVTFRLWHGSGSIKNYETFTVVK